MFAFSSCFASWTGRFAGAALMALAVTANSSAAELKYANQGVKWTPAERKDFYSLDQGARIMPFAWIKALKHPDGTGFLNDGFARYGYLPNPDSPTPGLPVGFLVADDNLSMTCAACHTRQIDVGGVSWRIDGGPALTDFQSFLADADAAFEKLLADRAAFAAFAKDVLGGSPSEDATQALHRKVDDWFAPYHTLMTNALVSPGWGVGRADAVSMIFNRVAGLDIGRPSRVILENIAHADAAVRYPFVWNGARQDMTQWPGFAKNGDDITGLARNVGEVYGVFGVYRPTETIFPNAVNFLDQSSLNIPGLLRLETLIKKIEPPKWPWALDQALAKKGEEIFNWPRDKGGCAKGCHEIARGEERVCNRRDTWKTPLWPADTDTREYQVLARTAKTGVLEGAAIKFVPGVDKPLKETDKIASILALSVVGSLVEAPLHFGPAVFRPLIEDCIDPTKFSPLALSRVIKEKIISDLNFLIRKPEQPPKIVYEFAPAAGHLGGGALSPQWLGADARRFVEVAGGTAPIVQDRRRL